MQLEHKNTLVRIMEEKNAVGYHAQIKLAQ